jgi:hypothetical protein
MNPWMEDKEIIAFRQRQADTMQPLAVLKKMGWTVEEGRCKC